MDEARRVVARYRPPYTQAQKAMRKAFGMGNKRRPRKRRARRMRAYVPGRRELRECREQRHGVDPDV